ncbi:MAG: HD domain-containing phosphohydrolase [Acidobacteriota bacterium]
MRGRDSFTSEHEGGSGQGSEQRSEKRLEQHLEQRLEDYETLLEIGVELAASLDLGEVLELALDRAERLCRAETSSIWQLDEATNELFFRVVRGRAAPAIRNLRVPLGAGIVGSVARRGRGEIVNDVANDPRWHGDSSAGFTTRALLAVPLKAGGRVVGVLQLLNPRGSNAFTEADLERMRLFAAPLGQAIDNARLYSALKGQYLDTVTVLAEAVEKRDPYTGGHVRRVVVYSVLLGQELGLSQPELERLRIAATLHDVGKIAVPDEVLRKPAPLDEGEQELMRRHPVDGAEILQRIPELRDILPGIRSHHERLDGAGYPDGLRDREIPTAARIIAVADTYDAMTTTRPYRRALSDADAVAEIERGAGSQFCPEVVAAFRRLVARDELSIDVGRRLIYRLFGEERADAVVSESTP